MYALFLARVAASRREESVHAVLVLDLLSSSGEESKLGGASAFMGVWDHWVPFGVFESALRVHVLMFSRKTQNL